MNRKHSREEYLSTIKKLRDINKDIKISSDFIIGYPGESEKDFESTIDLVKRVGFVNSYSFIFSPRAGTPAYELFNKNKLNNLEEIKKRLKKLQSILENYQKKNNKNFIHKYSEVLVENKLTNQEKYFGRTRCMLPVIFDSENCKPGDLVNVKINSYNQKNLFGVHFTSKTIAA